MLESPPSPVISSRDTSEDISKVSEKAGFGRLVISCWRKFWSAVDWLMGVAAIICGLAILSVIPILNFLSLGYLLEVSGRIARTGKIKSGFIGIRKASAVGSLAIGTWLTLLPVRFVSGLWKDAELINATGSEAKGWYVLLVVMTVLAAIHVTWAAIRGGRLRHFLWPAPLRFFQWAGQRGTFADLQNRLFAYARSLRIPYYLWLGFRGFAGAVIWLAVPCVILFWGASIGSDGAALLVGLLGGSLLMIVVMYLPFLQANFAKSGKFEALFRLKPVREVFRNAPIAFWFSLFATILFALPLYILKIELPPQDLAWLASIIFVILIFPARMLVGWAYARGERRDLPRHGIVRWGSRLAGVPVLMAYAFVVWITQYLSFNGSWSLFEQHAFLVPAPMLGL